MAKPPKLKSLIGRSAHCATPRAGHEQQAALRAGRRVVRAPASASASRVPELGEWHVEVGILARQETREELLEEVGSVIQSRLSLSV